MGVTIKDIAKIAGVNHSTVSRSLNDKPGVSESTRKKIKKIALDLGFEFNSNARGLSSSNKTETIGVIFPENYDEAVAGLFLNIMMKRMQYNIEKYNYDTIIEFPENRFNKKSNIKRIIDRKKIDGLILATPFITNSDYEYILKHNIPHVFLHNRPIYFKVESTSVYCNHEIGGFEAVNYLIQAGHEKIMMIQSLENNLHEFRERSAGYYKAFEENKLIIDRNLIFDSEIDFDGGYNTIMNNKHLLKEVTAVFFHSDIMALGGIKAMNELAYNVPEDISVMGYDDMEFGTYFHPYLTTVKQPIDDMAKIAVDKLMKLLHEKIEDDKEKISLRPELIIRESVKNNII